MNHDEIASVFCQATIFKVFFLASVSDRNIRMYVAVQSSWALPCLHGISLVASGKPLKKLPLRPESWFGFLGPWVMLHHGFEDLGHHP
jgi:hypothetical protein